MRFVSWVYTWIGVVIGFTAVDYFIHGITSTPSWASTHLRTDFATFLLLTVLATASVVQYKNRRASDEYIKKLDGFIDERDKTIEARDATVADLSADAAEYKAMYTVERRQRELLQLQIDILRSVSDTSTSTPTATISTEQEEITAEEFRRQVAAGEIDLSKVR